MKHKFKGWINNMQIRNKLMWMYIGAILVPIFVLFVGFVFSLVIESHDREALAREAANQRVMSNVYYLFENMNQVGIYFSADTELYQMLTNYDPNDYFDILNSARTIDNRISTINWAFPMVENISLYHNSEDLIDINQLNYLDDEARNTNWYKAYAASGADFYYSSDFHTNKMYLVMTNRVATYFTQGNIIIHQEIGQDNLSNALQDTYFYDNSRIFLLNPNNEIVATNDSIYNDVHEIQLFDELPIRDPNKLQFIPLDFTLHTNGWQVAFYIDQPSLINAFSTKIGFLLGILGLIFIGSIILVQVVSNSISTRLSGITKVMEVSQYGSFIKASSDNSFDEIGIVTRSYNRMVERFEKLLYEIRVSKNRSDMLLKEKVSAYDELESTHEEVANLNTELSSAFEENRAQNLKIHELIYNDILTGLNNRFSITNIIERSITENTSDHQVVVFVDVDNFKFINDTYGHDIGDLIIKETGNKLSIFESNHTAIGRFGGDEFLIFDSNLNSRIQVIDFLEAIMTAFKTPITVNDKLFYLTISMGVALYPEHGINRSELIKKADMALYRSKDTGKNRYTFYDAIFDEDLERKITLQNAVKDAAQKNEFYLNYQPYIDARTGELKGYEALIRWFSLELGQVSPYELITVAEELGLIVEIGDWIIEEALTFIKGINKHRDDKLVISINISPVQLLSKDFVNRLINITKAVGVTPKEICLEMTETVLIDSFTRKGHDLRMLNTMGFGIALDDFGTGYSSLSYFKELPVTLLKIDKSFIDALPTSVFNRELVKAIIVIAHLKGIKVTAEGVETLTQLETLKNFNCDTIQGYYFSKALDPKEAADYPDQSN